MNFNIALFSSHKHGTTIVRHKKKCDQQISYNSVPAYLRVSTTDLAYGSQSYYHNSLNSAVMHYETASTHNS